MISWETMYRTLPARARRVCSIRNPNRSKWMPPDSAKQDTDTRSTDSRIESLVRENAGWMLGLAKRILNDSALAEDAVQEALISAIQGLPEFEAQASIKTWLHRITVNAALSKYRKRKSLAEQSIEDLLPVFDQNDCRIEKSWDRLASVQDLIEDAQIRQKVLHSIRNLPDAYRIVLQLRDIEGYNTGETAELLKTSQANVKVRLHRARAALKKLLEPLLRGEGLS